MNTLFIIIQYFGIILLIIEIGIILYQDSSFNQSMMLIFTTSALINTIGYLMELQATSLELALYAVKFIYIGKPYIVLSMFLFVLNYCRVSHRKTVTISLFGLHTLIGISVLTCEYQNWFYTSISFTEEGIYPHLVLRHGFLYRIHMSMILLYSICMVICCIRRYYHSKDRIEKVHMRYLTLITLIPVLSFLIYLTKITNGYDITAPSYILCATMLLICSIRYNFLGTLRIAKDNALENMKEGIVVLNNSNELLYCNPKARILYPELNSRHNQKIINTLEEVRRTKTNLTIDHDIYSVTENPIFYRKNILGSMITLENITDSYFYTKRLQHDVQEKTKEIQQMQHSPITCFAALVEARNGVTGTHRSELRLLMKSFRMPVPTKQCPSPRRWHTFIMSAGMAKDILVV